MDIIRAVDYNLNVPYLCLQYVSFTPSLFVNQHGGYEDLIFDCFDDVISEQKIFIEKHLKASNFIKKRLQGRCFSVNITKFSRTPILKNNYERLLFTLSEILS